MPQIVHWNPRSRLGPGPILGRIPRWGRINNFGDLLGPWIVDRVHQHLGLGRAVSDEQRLITVGSIIRLGRTGDVVWGAGVNGKSVGRGSFPKLDVRAVRGPLSAETLRRSGCFVPEVYGDPALLIPHLWSDAELGIRRRSAETAIVPNFHDVADAPAGFIDPRGSVIECVRRIASAERVVASSLHAIVIADAYQVPAILVASSTEPPFKYEDYFLGTGRSYPPIARDWATGLRAQAHEALDRWDPNELFQSFPDELWEPA